MRILEVIPSFEPLGGAENFVFNLSISLLSNAEVFVVSLYDKENQFVSQCLKEKNISIIYLNKRKGLDFNCSRQFKRIMKTVQPDVVHMHLNTYMTCLESMIKRKSVFIYTFHTFITKKSYGNKMKPTNLLLRFLIRFGFMNAVTISDTVDESFKEYFSNLKSSIIYNGIDISKYLYLPSALKKYDFISVGSFNDIKNNLFMIKAFEKIISEGYDVNYVVLGDGKNFEVCNTYCQEHNLQSKIHLVGKVNNVEKYFAESSCLLLASHWEGNPLVVNEAIASGVWVIANNVGGIKDLVDNTCGYLVTPESEDDFIRTIRMYLNNRNEITNSLIPSNIENNRKRVDLKAISDEYFKLMVYLCDEV